LFLEILLDRALFEDTAALAEYDAPEEREIVDVVLGLKLAQPSACKPRFGKINTVETVPVEFPPPGIPRIHSNDLPQCRNSQNGKRDYDD
jgi:hypothetical protein